MQSHQQILKQKAAQAVLAYLDPYSIIGVGSGSTVKCFIETLAQIKSQIDGCVASSMATAMALRDAGLPVLELPMVDPLEIYIDSADEVTSLRTMIKGGGGALTREKIIAAAAKRFICIVDESKFVPQLGGFPIAVEVLPLARSLVGREIVKLGGQPVYREQFITDNGNIILDVHGLDLTDLLSAEIALKQIPGVVESGLFIKRPADQVLVASADQILVF